MPPLTARVSGGSPPRPGPATGIVPPLLPRCQRRRCRGGKGGESEWRLPRDAPHGVPARVWRDPAIQGGPRPGPGPTGRSAAAPQRRSHGVMVASALLKASLCRDRTGSSSSRRRTLRSQRPVCTPTVVVVIAAAEIAQRRRHRHRSPSPTSIHLDPCRARSS